MELGQLTQAQPTIALAKNRLAIDVERLTADMPAQQLALLTGFKSIPHPELCAVPTARGCKVVPATMKERDSASICFRLISFTSRRPSLGKPKS